MQIDQMAAVVFGGASGLGEVINVNLLGTVNALRLAAAAMLTNVPDARVIRLDGTLRMAAQ